MRCSPQHHSRPRYDTVLVNLDGKVAFGVLYLVFGIHIADDTYTVALIQTFKRTENRRSAEIRQKDKDLGFLRLQKGPTQFIWARSIIRGVPIFPAYDILDDFIVFDVIDADMMLRMQDLREGRDRLVVSSMTQIFTY